MREILFKAKRIDNGEWVEGYYIYHIKRTLSPVGDWIRPSDEQHVIMKDGFSDWNMPRDTVHYDIDPNTLCEFTGLKDKNGRRIWEGDIVLMPKYGKGKHKAVVYFMNGKFAVDGSNYGFKDLAPRGYEVIGNIYDNPELMEG